MNRRHFFSATIGAVLGAFIQKSRTGLKHIATLDPAYANSGRARIVTANWGVEVAREMILYQAECCYILEGGKFTVVTTLIP